MLQVLDLSLNRISRISKKQLSRFTRLKLLYLSDNKIATINPDTFDSNTDLQVLDLSLNPILTLPSNLFKLPSLRKLYLGEDEWLNVVKTFEDAKPITSPIEFLDISATRMDILPDLGVMPYLLKYNISNLPEQVIISVKHFAGLCNLKFLENAKVSAVFEDPCECFTLEKWLKERKVRFKSFNCPPELAEGKCRNVLLHLINYRTFLLFSDCTALLNVSTENLALFHECKEIYDKIVLSSKLVKILVPIAVIIVIALLVAAYLVLRRKKRSLQKKSKVIMTNNKTDGQTLI